MHGTYQPKYDPEPTNLNLGGRLRPLVGKRITAAFWGTSGEHPTSQCCVLQMDDGSAIELRGFKSWMPLDLSSNRRELIAGVNVEHIASPSAEYWKKLEKYTAVIAADHSDPRTASICERV